MQCVQEWVLMQVLTPSDLFSRIFCQKLSKLRFFLNLLTLPKTFHPVVQTIRVNWLREVHWIALRKISELFGVRSVPDRWCGQSTLGVGHFLKLFLPFAIILLRLSSLGKCPQVCMSPHNPRHLLSVHVILGLREKSLKPVFGQKLSGKLGFLVKFWYPDSYFFT